MCAEGLLFSSQAAIARKDPRGLQPNSSSRGKGKGKRTGIGKEKGEEKGKGRRRKETMHILLLRTKTVEPFRVY